MLGSTIKFRNRRGIHDREYTIYIQQTAHHACSGSVMAADHSMRSDLHAFHINMCMQTLMSVNYALMTVTIEEWLTVMTLLVVSIARVKLATLAVEEMEHA